MKKNNIFNIIKNKLKNKIGNNEDIIVDFLIQGRFYNNENLKNFIYFMFYNKDKYLNDTILSTSYFLNELEDNKIKFDALLPLEQMPKNFDNKENTFINKDYFQINVSLNYKYIDEILLFITSLKELLKDNENFIVTVNTFKHIYPDVYFITNDKILTNVEEIERRYNDEYLFYINKQKENFIKKNNKRIEYE